MCNLEIPNETSIYGKSFDKAAYSTAGDRDFKAGLYVSFDLGAQRDYTVLTFARVNKKTSKLTVIHHLGVSGVGTKEHDLYIRNYCKQHKINEKLVTLLLPFDSKNSMRGWERNGNTYDQFKRAGWRCKLVKKISIAKGIEVTRKAIECGDIQFSKDLNIVKYIKKIKGFEYKQDSTGKNTYIPDHGRAGDAPSNFADSLKYLCIEHFLKSNDDDFELPTNNYQSVF